MCWPRDWGGDTLFLDTGSETGILVRPKVSMLRESLGLLCEARVCGNSLHEIESYIVVYQEQQRPTWPQCTCLAPAHGRGWEQPTPSCTSQGSRRISVYDCHCDGVLGRDIGQQ
jgi:hypothetical protein